MNAGVGANNMGSYSGLFVDFRIFLYDMIVKVFTYKVSWKSNSTNILVLVNVKFNTYRKTILNNAKLYTV